MVDVSIVIPCLNEALSLRHCIDNAKEALARIRSVHGLEGEVVIADNGSTDGSQLIALRAGARVVLVSAKGYGAALIGGFQAAEGRFLVMGDADGSYDFCDAVPMIGRLLEGADLCMGSRFKGGIKPGAMPWKNRYIGNPVLSGILKLFFRTSVSDAHCGIRALTKDCFKLLRLSGAGMEFASEMVIKAALLKVRIDETPATLHPDLRDRPPHLRPWRDGWRHLRYLLMLSPTWVFAMPAAAGALVAFAILARAVLQILLPSLPPVVGNYWVIAAAAIASVSHMAAILALGGHVYGLKEGYRRPGKGTARVARWVSLETMLVGGLGAMASGAAVLTAVLIAWTARDFGRADGVLPAVGGTLLLTLGAQTILGGFLLAIIGGNEARFMHSVSVSKGDGLRALDRAA